MVKTFITAVKLENACRVNKMLNSINKLKKNSNNSSNTKRTSKLVKVTVGILTTIKYIVELFGSKMLALFLIYGALQGAQGENIFPVGTNAFFHIFLFSSIVECFARVEPTR